jgi:hypothetical protein
MLGTPFTHDMIRKYVVAFGTMFNNIKLQRIEKDADTQWISVPLSYAPKEKWHARLTDPRITQQVAISLPRISYELVTATYAPERKMNTMNRHVGVAVDQDSFKNMFAPVPYDFQFSLFVYSRNAADASNIIEQILPFFTPEFTVTINDATDLNIDVDCPIILNSVSREDTYEGDFESRRVVTWTLDFTMKGLLFGPVRESKVIKKAYVDFFIPPTDSRTVYHSGNLAINSATTSEIYLATTASRVSNTYDSGTITITAEGPSGTTSIAGNTRTITSYDGSTQKATVVPAFLSDDIPQDTWSYEIQYLTADRSGSISSDQLLGIPTVTRIYTQPGLTVDGDPTSNGLGSGTPVENPLYYTLSVDVDEIDAGEDFGIIQTRTFFPSNNVLAGTRRNLKTGDDEL